MPNRWKPNVTVSAIIERDGRFLLVEEETPDGLRLNNPAGHLDFGESLAAACVRETLEETAYDFTRTDENLILYTCYPFDALGFTPNRYFVYAKYVSGPVLDKNS